MTLSRLINAYLSDPESPFSSLEYVTAGNYRRVCRRIAADHGDVELATVTGRMLQMWHREWKVSGVSMAHSLMSMLRIVTGYGATLWEDTAGNAECARIRAVLKNMRFAMGVRRKVVVTFEQALQASAQARRRGFESIALAQAFQFESLIRQKDAIGSWVPERCTAHPEPSDVVRASRKGRMKWIKGIRFEELDERLILRHVTSKKKKELAVDLTTLPMVVEELARQFFGFVTETTDADGKLVRAFDRGALPATGPIIVNEATGLPWTDDDYRDKWRELAREVGIPDHVQNRDSRAGGISEGVRGDNIEDARSMATHSDANTTRIYVRNELEAQKRFMAARVAARNGVAT